MSLPAATATPTPMSVLTLHSVYAEIKTMYRFSTFYRIDSEVEISNRPTVPRYTRNKFPNLQTWLHRK